MPSLLLYTKASLLQLVTILSILQYLTWHVSSFKKPCLYNFLITPIEQWNTLSSVRSILYLRYLSWIIGTYIIANIATTMTKKAVKAAKTIIITLPFVHNLFTSKVLTLLFFYDIISP